ncbi:16S rRNA (guanine(527)-N(7))-methyltransferase RsmG [Paludisphaera borealis]|uniref:Ribosomal RNA small subunit methyltransferase G n=1 Tax=Paludisphaera borealis TaxID=1387353 RepID=A0A1U7CJG9_9BACT|nr:16S rRNA (guanine(527)-N(7))-methyltransferase RsmG [Paludisphaera borealis]APW59033.1 Ribosomal RNA small subunit methyltransferase G [Paludisphaera borealis]
MSFFGPFSRQVDVVVDEEESLRPGRSALEVLMTQCGITLSSEQLDALWAYHQMLRAANPILNLTRIHNFENMVLKHYVDSLLTLRFVELPSPLIDMGSGPGLPGVPLKIARPETHMILAEPRAARVEFLGQVCERLGLKDVEVYGRKLGADYPGRVKGVISRAVAAIPETLERVAACLEPGGRMIFMKGPGCDPEIAEAERTWSDHFRLASDHAYTIPGTTHDRRLVVYERLDTDAPRGAAEARASRAFDGPVREITSESNPTYRLLSDLLTGRGVRKHGQAILAGLRITSEVQEKFADRVVGWITDASGPAPADASWTWYRLSPPLFKTLDVAGTRAPLLLVATPETPAWSDDAPWPEGCTLFVPFQDPENVGAVIRSAAAFGVPRVVLLQEAAHPFHPRSSRAAGPALFQTQLMAGPSVHALESSRYPLISLDASGDDVGASPFPPTFGLVVGLEGPGLPQQLRRGERRRIAMAPGVESLNAATSAAVALYVWSRRGGG